MNTLTFCSRAPPPPLPFSRSGVSCIQWLRHASLSAAFALCPYSPEAVFRYVNLLIAEARSEDALRVAEAALNVAPKNGQFKGLVQPLRNGKTPPNRNG